MPHDWLNPIPRYLADESAGSGDAGADAPAAEAVEAVAPEEPPAGGAEEAGAAGAEPGVGWKGIDQVPWSQLWHVPALLLGLGLFTLGVWSVVPSHDPPDYMGQLDDVDTLIRAESRDVLEQAREKLDGVGAEFEVHPPSNEVRGRYWQYAGDLNYLDQTLTSDQPVATDATVKNLNQVLKYYEDAEDFGRPIDERSKRWTALSLVLLGRDADALAMLDELDPGDAHGRYRIVRELIERHLEAGAPDPAALERLLARFEKEFRQEPDPLKRVEQWAWLVALRAQRYLDVDDPERAITYLSVEMQRLRAAGRAETPELTVLLAEAFQRRGQFDEARRHYRLAQRMIEPGDLLNGRTLVGLADIELAAGGDGYLDRALGLYQQARKQYPTSDVFIDAIAGMGNVQAQQDAYAQAVADYRLAIAQLLDNTPPWDPRRDQVTNEIQTHVERALQQNRYEDALDLLATAEPLYRVAGAELPAEFILQFAQVHEQIAEERMAYAQERDPLTWRGPGEPPVAARRQAFQEAATHFGRSADYFLDHARRVTAVNADLHGTSLWSAGRNYDRAQLWEDAIKVYDEFLASRPEDGQFLRAQHQLAGAYQSDRQYHVAIELFTGLVDEHPTSRWAYESLVPLARSYVAVDEPQNAIKTLKMVLENNPAITPDSDTYRDALIDLARTYYIMGDDAPAMYAKAIETLHEAVQRYGDQTAGPELKYMLGDALRRSIGGLDEQLALSIPQRQRLELQATRNQRLEEAEQYYAQARAALEARHELSLSPLEKLYRRNAWFYEADCPFLRGDYSAAIDKYREAAERWQDDPASLVAWVQIVNAYCEMEEFASARTANNKALLLLDRMDDSAFDRPEMPMTRRHWQDWLRWSSELDLFGRQASAER